VVRRGGGVDAGDRISLRTAGAGGSFTPRWNNVPPSRAPSSSKKLSPRRLSPFQRSVLDSSLWQASGSPDDSTLEKMSVGRSRRSAPEVQTQRPSGAAKGAVQGRDP
jgi:hypothetical protein